MTFYRLLQDNLHDGLAGAAADGGLWDLWFTSVPKPEQTRAYIADALAGQRDAKRHLELRLARHKRASS